MTKKTKQYEEKLQAYDDACCNIFVYQIIYCIFPEKCLYFFDKIWQARPLCSSTYVLHSNRLGSFGVKAIRVMSFSFLVFSVRAAAGSLISL